MNVDDVSVDGHTHVFDVPTIRRDIVAKHLIVRFGDRWWFQVCEICAGVCRVCPASNEFGSVAPEVPADWELWRRQPAQFEITQTRRAP